MHIPADHKKAYLVSIPRDLYVPIPENAGASCDSGSRNKINASFAWGGLPLAVRTVECVTDVRIDHVVAIDFGGFKEVTDALGGVDLKVDRTITSIHKPYRKFTKGMHHMNGAEALDWVRQRKQFPEGDFARMRHQQEFLKALLDKAASGGTLTNPMKLNDFLKAVTKAVKVDQEFSLTDMALQFRDLRGDNDLHYQPQPRRAGRRRSVGGALRPGEGAGDVPGHHRGQDGRVDDGQSAGRRYGERQLTGPKALGRPAVKVHLAVSQPPTGRF